MAIRNVSIDSLKTKKAINFRKDMGDMDVLCQEILDENGIREPLLVIANKDGKTYTVIDGERRLKAVKTAIKKGLSLKTVPIVIEDVESEIDQILMKMAGVNSVGGLRMTPTEEAAALKFLTEHYRVSTRDASRRLKLKYDFNMTAPTALDRLRLLDGSERLKHAIDYEEYPLTLAKKILMAYPGDFETQDKMVEETVYDKQARKELNKKLDGVTTLYDPVAKQVLKYAKSLQIEAASIDELISALEDKGGDEIKAAIAAGQAKGIMGALGNKVKDPFAG